MHKTFYVCDICGAKQEAKPIYLSRYLTVGFLPSKPVLFLDTELYEICDKCRYALLKYIYELKEKAEKDAQEQDTAD